ncbi:N-acetylneuraminate synthase [Paenibacillus thalictri]|uniref:N-acetylneuraminate synthase n=1 Tax=Paenibacillus thalictri TaxID=2527873 RepID=A0A4Q9DL20_9BACL|nr:N-acetylneuraminate synthase [Paenibacillus thalictri]TBL73008.1 N-acetylneuraminate synthase [Paenibacillus thalictri]
MIKKRTYIIAEAGVNHNGSLDLAIELVDAAVKSGADAIKFQTFKSESLVSKSAPKSDYQLKTTELGESQLEMLKKLELSVSDHYELKKICDKYGIEFLSTPFDFDSLDLLERQMGMETIKISSGDLSSAPFLLAAAKTKKRIILSTGLSCLGEIETALGVLAFGLVGGVEMPSIKKFKDAYTSSEGQALLQKHVSLLHCTTEYPTPYDEVNLKAMDTLKAAFQLPVGLSDHTEGIAIPIAAVAIGATIIEKHFTLDRNLPGPDHKASLDAKELKAMVAGIRQVEMALGSGIKTPAPSELKNMHVARKSLIATKKIAIGDIYTEDNIGIKRPGNGLAPIHYWEMLGKSAMHNFDEDDLLE